MLDGGVIQQVGSPQELYDRPANLFVANFLGTANILKGQVEIDGDEMRFVTETGDTLGLPSVIGSGTNVVLRPQNITIQQTESKDTLQGEILHREFLGSQIRYLVRAAGAEIVVDQSHVPEHSWFENGATVHLRANTAGAVLL